MHLLKHFVIGSDVIQFEIIHNIIFWKKLQIAFWVLQHEGKKWRQTEAYVYIGFVYFLKLQTKFKNSQTLIIGEKVAFDYFDVGCEVTRYIFIFLMFSENDHTNQRKSINK